MSLPRSGSAGSSATVNNLEIQSSWTSSSASSSRTQNCRAASQFGASGCHRFSSLFCRDVLVKRSQAVDDSGVRVWGLFRVVEGFRGLGFRV